MPLTKRAFLGTAAATLLAPLLRASAPLSVVATTGMIADAVTQIGGGAVTVRTLMGPGIDPHAYRQTRTDIAALVGADLVLWHGLYLEAQMEGFLRDLASRKPTVAVAEGLDASRLIAHDEYADRTDPHVWMDPALWAGVVAEIRDALIAADADAAAVFEARAARYLAEIATLGDYAQAVLASVPSDARVLLTAHDAFNYFGAAFGFEVAGIQGISTESEAGLQRIAELVEMLVTRDIRAVFVESSVSDRNIRALIEGAAARDHRVVIGGELFSDAMGVPGTYEGTYIGMIDHNVTTIAHALGGRVPAGGMAGRLEIN